MNTNFLSISPAWHSFAAPQRALLFLTLCTVLATSTLHAQEAESLRSQPAAVGVNDGSGADVRGERADGVAGYFFIRNTTVQQTANFNISGNGTAANLTAGGTVSANVVNAATQYNIGGSQVLSIGIAGSDNLFAGINAGTTGEVNSFFGSRAGGSNTTGIENSFFGAFAGSHNTEGRLNTFVGAFAGSFNTTGFTNSFVGGSAGQSNTTGNHNSFFGMGAGISSTEGNRNSFFGFSAGVGNTTGSNNTIIGDSADVGAGDLTFATAIGASANRPYQQHDCAGARGRQ